jgi:hypothetical protein
MAGWTQAAHAATQTFTFLGGKSGKTASMKVSVNGGATFSGLISVGVYKGTLSAEPSLGEIEMYCADVYHAIGTPFQTLVSLGRFIDAAQPLVGPYYEDGAGNGGGAASAMTAADYHPTLPGANPAFDTIAKRVDAVSYLAHKYLNSSFSRDILARVQLAIWDIMQDGGDGVGAGQGAIQAKDGNDLYVDISAILTEAAGQGGVPRPRWLQAPRLGGNPGNHAQDLVFDAITPVQVCGKVFNDYDNDCFHDTNEPIMEGVEITLVGDADGDGDGDTRTTTTDAQGRYCFADLVPGHYTVTVTVPAGFAPSTGAPTSLNVAALIPGSVYDENNFCLRCVEGSLGDRVWHDADGDGVQDAGEAGLVGVKVILTDLNGDPVVDAFGNVVGPVWTGANGAYLFEHLCAGSYKVTVDAGTLPAGLNQQTYDLNGPLDNMASVTLGPGEVNLDVDFGYTRIGNGATRTIGWWSTHLQGIQAAVANHCVDLGILLYGVNQSQNLTNPTVGDLEAILWGNIAKQGRTQRSALGHARMQLGQQLVAALANACLLGTSTESKGFSATLLADARAAFDGTDVSLILSFIGQVDAFNNSGDPIALDSAQSNLTGPAQPQASKAAANRNGNGEIDPGPAFR